MYDEYKFVHVVNFLKYGEGFILNIWILCSFDFVSVFREKGDLSQKPGRVRLLYTF